MPEPRIPPALLANVHGLLGDRAGEWLARLPVIIEECTRRWDLVLGEPYESASYNWVAPGTSRGRPVVLKVGVREQDLWNETRALRIFGGLEDAACVGILDGGPALGAILLERAVPGTVLSDLEDDERATAIAADVMRRLAKTPAPVASDPREALPTIDEWGRAFARLRERFAGGTGPLPRALVDEAESRFAELSASAAPAVLLHADLHHGNILDAGRAWLAIDPQGVVGEPAYETGPLLRNLSPRLRRAPHPERILRRRVHLLADALALDPRRVRGWGMAQAVLSAVWSVEDGATDASAWAWALWCAEALRGDG